METDSSLSISSLISRLRTDYVHNRLVPPHLLHGLLPKLDAVQRQSISRAELGQVIDQLPLELQPIARTYFALELIPHSA